MAIESIKCNECGSVEVTEFKHATYICGHCETVFKWSSGAAFFAPESCNCGKSAAGRCKSCEKPICDYHSEGFFGEFLCLSCHNARRLEFREGVGRLAEARKSAGVRSIWRGRNR